MTANEKIVGKQLVDQSYQRIKQNISFKSLVHYTNTEVLDALIKNATFWASNILYLNDSKEFFEGVEIINKELSNLKINDANLKVEGGIYTISFCAFNDELSQWITYAKESGVAIELDLDLLNYNPKTWDKKNEVSFYFVLESIKKYDITKGKREEEKSSYGPQHFRTADVLRKIEYVDKARSTIKDMLKDDPGREGVNKEDYRLLASYIKNDKFSIENEIRASFCYNESFDGSVTKINYKRLNNGVLRPFIKAQISIRKTIEGKTSEWFEACLPLKSVTIGPSGVQQAVFDSVVHRLKNGERKIFNYAEKDFEKFSRYFADYLEEVLKFAQENKLISYEGHVKISENDADNKGIKTDVNKIIKLKVTDEKGQYSVNLAAFVKRLICFLNKDLDRKVNIIINGEDINNLSEDAEDDDAIRVIRKNFYFTEEGVLIRKSKIPYIF